MAIFLQRVCTAVACALVLLLPFCLQAADLKFSAFGTLGYAISDQEFPYLRYIDDGGTLKADSLVGVQAEAQFNSQWSATVQLVASAPRTRDDGYEAKIRWAFLSFRPTNDWLLRAGRLRPPVFINTQNAEVGVTYDQARLPVEVYSLSPVYDIDGAAVNKTWLLDDSEINLEAYWGKTDVKYRLPFQREGPQVYFPETVTFQGLVLSRTAGPLFLRGGVHQADFKAKSDAPFLLFETYTPVPVPAPPPIGGTLYVPVNPLDRFSIQALTLGADWRSGDWRVTAEYGQRISNDTKLVANSKSAYVTVSRGVGKWTPYATYARMLPSSEARTFYNDVNGTPVPLAVQGPPLFVPGNLHRVLADRIVVSDQYSTMLGTSYSFSSTSKLKFEWMRTKVGLVSSFVDGDVHNKSFNVFSASYSVAF